MHDNVADLFVSSRQGRFASGIVAFYLDARSFDLERDVAIRLRIGTRKSTMALAQTEEIARRLRAAVAGIEVDIVKFETTGDIDQTGKLLKHGGKGGAFVAEIRDAVRAGKLHAAMHSLKDMPGNEDTPGLVIGATLPRDPPTDVLVLRPELSLQEFTRSGGKLYKIGTNAVRRAAYARRLYPNVEVIHYRGAADTRVRKLDRREKQRLADGGEAGPADALIMARAGLERVGLAGRIAYEFSAAEMLPAVGQGIVAVECAANEWQTRNLLSAIDDLQSHRCAAAEREVLWVLNGHCNSPVAGFATIDGALMSLSASVLDESGGSFIEASRTGPADRPRELGRAVGFDLLAKGAAGIIERSRPR
jgi:hydroxymethylbilane synthase